MGKNTDLIYRAMSEEFRTGEGLSHYMKGRRRQKDTKMINEALLSKVFGFKCSENTEVGKHKNEIAVDYDDRVFYLNKYELAYKCKRYIETETIYYIIVGFEVVFVTTDMWAEGGLYFEKEFKEGDEPQRIIDACEWALEKSKEK